MTRKVTTTSRLQLLELQIKQEEKLLSYYQLRIEHCPQYQTLVERQKKIIKKIQEEINHEKKTPSKK